MFDALVGNWWAVALRAVVGMLFGVLVLVVPGLTLGLLVTLFGLWALVDGAFALLLAARIGGRAAGAGWMFAEGGVGVAAGVLALLWPGISVLVLLRLVALRAIVAGALAIRGGARLHQAGADWLYAFVGVVAIVIGVLLVVQPAAWLVALLALAVGVVWAPLAVRLRALARGSAGRDRIVATV